MTLSDKNQRKFTNDLANWSCLALTTKKLEGTFRMQNSADGCSS